jgi:hypothetical protein
MYVSFQSIRISETQVLAQHVPGFISSGTLFCHQNGLTRQKQHSQGTSGQRQEEYFIS